jgi:hypothetical protein
MVTLRVKARATGNDCVGVFHFGGRPELEVRSFPNVDAAPATYLTYAASTNSSHDETSERNARATILRARRDTTDCYEFHATNGVTAACRFAADTTARSKEFLTFRIDTLPIW